MSLYELTDQFLQLKNLMGEDIPEEVIIDTLESISGEIEEKGSNIIIVMKNVQADIFSIENAEKELSKRKKSLKNKLNKLNTYLLDSMIKCDIKKIRCEKYGLKAVMEKSPHKISDNINMEILPSEFKRISTTITPDKIKIKEAISNGVEIPGVTLEENRVKLSIKAL
jgi:hypothetical protein